MKDNIQLIKFFLTSFYAKPKQPVIQVLLIIAFIYLAVQYFVLTFTIYFIATPEEYLFYNVLLSNGVTYLLISYFAISVVFSQSDFAIFAHLPISAKKVVISKIISGVTLPIMAVSILSIPTFFIFLIEFKLGVAIKSLLLLLVMNVLIVLFLLFVLSILNHFRSMFSNTSVYLLVRMTLIVGIGISPILYFLIKNYHAMSTVLVKLDVSTISSLSASISDFLEIGYRFAMQQSLVETLLSLNSAISFISLFALCYVLFKATIKMIASKYYEHGMLVSRIEKTTKVWGRDIQSSLVNYLQREYWIIQSEPYFKMQAILGIILTPICTIIFLILLQMNMIKAEWIVNNESFLFAYMVLLMSCMNNISGTPYSREGKYYASSMTLPFDPQKIYMAKIMTSSCIGIISVVISYIIYMLFGRGDIITGLHLLITLLLVITYNLMSPLYDRRLPLLEWSNPSEAIKSNPTVLISLLYGLPLLIVIGLLHFSLLSFNVSPSISVAIILIIVILCAITLIYKIFNRKNLECSSP
ncbi:hypothetical protein FJQ98_07800 [Lysinibacillus agricola]|uniref:ABC transporter permease n=1 Tax=Lysinibacillus agricola TaxID=2590012 RepID=A0ABX7AVT6_9BACI|nr:MULTISPECIES: hypothetical protein [Lysinibacillus]KOS62957.1 hypothetical protein AN161_11705 [Lysinibacillus sp. FJAT-14222]QQP13926.1 hypothetical protein FJQ98_07800 [Lysinibacillus agricola]